MNIFLTILIIVLIPSNFCLALYYASLSHDGPVILGATITFKVEVFTGDGERASNGFRFIWKDDAIPHHQGQTDSDNGESSWNVSYPASNYVPGKYEAQVEVKKNIFGFYYTVTSQRIKYDVTAKLNGQMKISQNGVTRKGEFVSNVGEVKHRVVLSSPDMEYLSSATQVLSYWYVDCVYYGQSEGYDFYFNYTQENQVQIVEVLVMATFEPLPTPEPSTTTTTTLAPTTTTTPTSTTSQTPGGNNVTTETSSTSTTTATTLSSSTASPNNVTKTPVVVFSNVDGRETLNIKQGLTQGLGDNVPNICMNTSIIPPDPKKIYGYFSRQLKIKAPVSNVTVNGTSWLARGDVIYLNVKCHGSMPYSHCVQIMPGLYNATGNETCRPAEMITGSVCEFSYQHYLSAAVTYTALIIINNEVNYIVTPFAINIYEVTKKAQLSVIVVPVVCTILAVILMIFGVAYYVQNRRRFVVEVADFHFGHTDVDMECKTFQERLREAIMNAFSRSVIEDDSDSESCDSDRRTGHGMWPGRGFGNTAGPSTGVSGVPGNVGGRGDARGQKYGSME